jgi:DNA-binding phage protein
MTRKISPRGSSLDEIASDLIRRDPMLVDHVLTEAAQALFDNEIAVARNLLRNVIKGSMGYAELSRMTGTPEKSLVRMFGPKGNPVAANLFAVLAHLQRRAGVRLQVASAKLTRPDTRRARSRRAA